MELMKTSKVSTLQTLNLDYGLELLGNILWRTSHQWTGPYFSSPLRYNLKWPHHCCSWGTGDHKISMKGKFRSLQWENWQRTAQKTHTPFHSWKSSAGSNPVFLWRTYKNMHSYVIKSLGSQCSHDPAHSLHTSMNNVRQLSKYC